MTCGRPSWRKTASLYPPSSTYFPLPSVSSSSEHKDVHAMAASYPETTTPPQGRRGWRIATLARKPRRYDARDDVRDVYLFNSGSGGCAGLVGSGLGAGVGAGCSGLGAGVSTFGCSG